MIATRPLLSWKLAAFLACADVLGSKLVGDLRHTWRDEIRRDTMTRLYNFVTIGYAEWRRDHVGCPPDAGALATALGWREIATPWSVVCARESDGQLLLGVGATDDDIALFVRANP